ncbi:MAG: sodium/solute symporter [Opitutales bacterium]|nr:sodium/solute symporter [Opitutales bacterium]
MALSIHTLKAVDIEARHTVLTADIPYAAEGMVFTQLAGEFLVIGGVRDGQWLQGGSVYHADSDEWESFELPFAIRDAAFTSDRNRAWIVGGEGPDGPSTQAWQLTPGRDSVVEVVSLPKLPMEVQSPSLMFFNRFLYLAGELDGNENVLLRLNLRAQEGGWESLSLWSDRFLQSPFFGVQNSQLFLSGIDPRDELSPVYRLSDVRDTEWSSRQSAPYALHPTNGVPSGHSNLLFIHANSDVSDELNSHTIITYNVITDTWTTVGAVGGLYDHYFFESIRQQNYLAGIRSDGTGSLSEVWVGMASRPFGFVDYSIIILYIIVLIAMGFYFSRREKGSDDYFVGGRKVPWWAVGVSLYATGTSAISFMAISGRTYSANWLYFTSVFFGLMLAAIVALILVPLIRKLNIVSTYEYLELRFHVSVRLLGSIILILTQLGSRMSVVLFLPALALSKVTGISVVESVIAMGIIATVYTYMGGIKAVIWTDVVQVFILLGGAFFCLFYVVSAIDGGFVGFITVANEYDKMQIFDWRLTLEAATVSVFFLAAFAGIMTIPNDQVMMQRVLSTKDEKAATKSIWTLTLITIPGNLVFFALGTALWVFYANFPERMDPSLQFDATFPHFVAHEFPIGLAGLVISALFAASMSTLDSGMNSVATVFSVDFYKRFKKNATDDQVLRVARIVTLLAGAFATTMALVLTRYSLPSLWDTMILLTGLIGGGFGGVFALGMFTRRANSIGAVTGVLVSLVTALSAQAFTNVHVFMILPIAVFTVVIVGYLVSMVTPHHNKDLHGLTLHRIDQRPRE